MLLLHLLACGSSGPPAWGDLSPVTLEPDGGGVILDASAWLADRGDGRPYLQARAAGGLLAQVHGADLSLLPAPGFRGSTTVELTVTDRQGRSDQATLQVMVGSAACPVTLTHWPQGGDAVSAVRLDGDILDAVLDPQLEPGPDGAWTTTLDLPPGAWPYRFVETLTFSQSDEELSYCDPQAEQILCPAGYKEPWEVGWSHDCAVPEPACDSLLVVHDCTIPKLVVTQVSIDRTAGAITASVQATPGAAEIATGSATLDDAPLDVWDGTTFHVEQSDLTPGRHTLRFTVTDTAGNTSEEVWIPFWTDADPEQGWRAGSVYYAFVDRLVNGEPGNDADEGATAELAGFMGGDWAGTMALLPYLDDLGVRTLWISNPQDNVAGAWPGLCEQDYAGYHAYWPVGARGVEEHFGTDAELRALVQAAHARGMRVVMDWVANHVHEEHPYAIDHPEWFHPLALCEDWSGSEQNWTAIPESCWFAPYLPDLDYARADVMTTMLDDALWWARTYDLDGFRVDAAKHMPHSVQYNLQARVAAEIEHRAAGGDTEFWTVGETFDGADRIAAYVGEDQLDGQFDFPIYWGIRSALGSRSSSLADLSGTMADSRDRYAGALMSTFLGNHDVTRFTTELAEGGADICAGEPLARADGPWEDWPYERLAVAWAFVLTRPDVPLIYYGDELGMPGYGDPDNRQPLWWFLDGLPASTDEARGMVDERRAEVLRQVAAIGRARRDHPALYSGTETEWWLSGEVLAWARTTGEDHALVILNPSDSGQWLTNGLSFAGLPTDGAWTDVVSAETLWASGDQLSVWVDARSARVLIRD